VLDDEVQHYLRGLPHVCRVESLPQGLHNDPPDLSRQLRALIVRLEDDPNVRQIALVYGLCSRGTEGLAPRRCTLVIPRAHDCITILLGSRERYGEYVRQHPGTYWYSPGWNKHHVPPGQERYERLFKAYEEKYGRDNAEFLMETEQQWFRAYNRATYVHLSIANTPADVAYTRQCAEWLKWGYDEQEGSPDLLVALLAGRWDADRFLVVRPGEEIALVADERVVMAVPRGTRPAAPPVAIRAANTEPPHA
jgi:hypothetical protein